MSSTSGDFHSREFIEAALEASHLAACELEISSGKLQWAGECPSLLGAGGADCLPTLSALLESMLPSDRDGFESILRDAREKKVDFRFEFRLHAQQGTRWYSVKGRFCAEASGRSDRCLCVFEDVSERKHAEMELLEANASLKVLNDRLQVGMADSHHRVKNSLQNVISMLNLQVRKSGTLGPDQVKKLSSLIYGLATLHDILNEQSRARADVRSVAVNRIFERVVGIATRDAGGRNVESRFEPCLVTPRQASSLNVIFNELVSNALTYGSGAIFITLETQAARATLTVKNEGSQFPVDFSPASNGQTGLALVKLLCASDLNCEPHFHNDGLRFAVASIDFSVLSACAESALSGSPSHDRPALQ